jgi:hypothetical protein
MKPLTSLLLLFPLFLNAQDPTPRMWTNQQGRSIKAALVEVSGVNVVIQLENGTKSTVHVGTLSKADQDYLQKFQGTKPAGSAAPTGPLEWPKEILSIDPKTIVVIEGKQDDAARRYHYTTGNFEFISTAPLAGTVMADVAADFLLTEKFFVSLPWNWSPRPKSGDRFTVYLAETSMDYITLGARENGSADIVGDNHAIIRFSALGLKKVGARYQYDARAKEPGRVTSILAYSMLMDVSGWLHPWTLQGMPNFLKYVAYQNNGTVQLTNLEASFKRAVKEQLADGKVKLDMARLIKYMRSSSYKDLRADVIQFRLEQQLDCFLLVYFFGFMDGDGSGAALHQFYSNTFARAKKSRSPEEAATMLQKNGMEKASSDVMISQIYANRDDARLAAEMTEKFKNIGLKF